MSSSSSRLSNKKSLNPKILNLKIAPFYTNNTTANSSNKNTLIMNSLQQNFYKNEKAQYTSRNISQKNERFNSFHEDKIQNRKKNISLKHIIKNNFIEAKEYSCNNKHKHKISNMKNNNYNNKSLCNDKKNSRTNNNSKKDNNNKINKNSIIILNKISGENKKSLKTFRLPMVNLLIEKIDKNKNKSKEKSSSINKSYQYNISRRKNDNSKEKKSFNSVNKKVISRNCNLRIQSSSLKNINTKITSNSAKSSNSNNSNKTNKNRYTNYNRTNCTTKVSCSNSLSKGNNNKSVYYKKKMDDTFQKKIDKIENQKLIKIKGDDYLSNHNYLVNLILENKKHEDNDKFSLYKKLKENNRINNINKKSTNSKSNKKIREKKNDSFIKDSSKNKEKLFKVNNKRHNIKKIIINKRNDNKILRKYKSVENIKLNNKSISKKNESNINDINKKSNTKRATKIIDKNNNSIINLGNKDSFIDMVDTITKFNKDKNDKETKINNIKINEFNVKKPKEENMKFTLLKNRYEDEENNEDVNNSKIIIGTIEGYKDIIESDKLNNYFYQKDNSINVLESNTLDNNSISKKINKKILLNFNLIDEKDYKNDNKKNNNIEGLEIYSNNTNNGFLLNDSEIKSILNCVEDENDIGDLSTTILKINKQYKNINLLPYHVNKISFEKKYSDRAKKYLIKENINNDSVLLVDNNKFSKTNKETDNKINKYNKEIKSTIGNNKEEIFKYLSKLKNNHQNKNNNVIQNSCNLFIERNDKKCVIF